MKRLIVFLAVLQVLWAAAQDFSGRFVGGDGDVLIIKQDVAGNLGGEVVSDGISLSLQGEVDAGVGYGLLLLPNEMMLGFLLIQQGADKLTLQIMPFDAQGQPRPSEAESYDFVRESADVNPLTPTPANPLAGAAQTGTLIVANQRYTAGTRLTSAVTGLTFEVPTGFQAEVQAGGIQLLTPDGTGFGLTAVAQLDAVAEAVMLVNNLLEDSSWQLLTAPEQSADRLRVSLFGSDNGQTLVLLLLARQSPAGNGVLLVGGGPRSQEQLFQQAVNSFEASLQLTAPQGDSSLQAWRTTLAGRDFNLIGTASEFAGSGLGQRSLSSRSEESYTFCSDGRYTYHYQDFTSFAAGEFSAVTEDSDSHQGSWRITQGAVGEPYLTLQASDGRRFTQALTSEAGGMVIGSGRFAMQPSQVCR